MSEAQKPRLIGINHVAIEVGNIDEALEWYGRIFDFTLRGRGERNAFIDMGDQFINMTLVPDRVVSGVEKRHLGFVVDDRSRIIDLAKAAARHRVRRTCWGRQAYQLTDTWPLICVEAPRPRN